MGEANRRKAHDTLDGGPPSYDKIGLEIHIFSPGPEAIFSGDKHAVTALRKICLRMHRRPTPICAACDYEFDFGEWPPLAHFMRPAFPKADAYTIIAGAICGQCARLPPDQLTQALFKHFKDVKPDAELAVTQ